MFVPRRVSALLLLCAAACDAPSTPSEPDPSAIAAVSGALQEGTVGAELPDPLVVRVTDAEGRVVAGADVRFVVTAGGGTVADAQAVTDAAGEARTRWTLATAAGDTQRVEARLDPAFPAQPAVFRAVGRAAAPGAPQAVGAPQRTGPAGATLAEPLAIRVVDAFGNPVAGVAVTWQVVAGGGTVTPLAAVTGADGMAAAGWALGPVLGAGQQVRATTAQGTVDFGAVATLPANAVLQAESGSGQTGQIRTVLPQPVVARVLLADGRPLQGATVQWVAAGTGQGSILPAEAVTGSDGRVSGVWSLPASPGALAFDATLPGTGATARFTATATPAPPHLVTGVPLASYTITAGDVVNLQARVTDVYGTALAGITVTWDGEDPAPDGSPPSSVTDAAGIAATQWTPTRRSYNRMNARVAATADTATWRVFVNPGPITQIIFVPGSLALPGAGDAEEVLLYAADAYGNRSLAASGSTLNLSSSNTAVATVPAQASDFDEGWRAFVTAEGPGTAVITATLTGLGVSGSLQVQVGGN